MLATKQPVFSPAVLLCIRRSCPIKTDGKDTWDLTITSLSIQRVGRIQFILNLFDTFVLPEFLKMGLTLVQAGVILAGGRSNRIGHLRLRSAHLGWVTVLFRGVFLRSRGFLERITRGIFRMAQVAMLW